MVMGGVVFGDAYPKTPKIRCFRKCISEILKIVKMSDFRYASSKFRSILDF